MSRILIVEDEAHLAQGLRFNLEAEGHSVQISDRGEEALARLLKDNENYDALVLGGLTHRKGIAPLIGTLTSKLVEGLDSDFILVKRAAPGHVQPARANIGWQALFGD